MAKASKIVQTGRGTKGGCEEIGAIHVTHGNN